MAKNNYISSRTAITFSGKKRKEAAEELYNFTVNRVVINDANQFRNNFSIWIQALDLSVFSCHVKNRSFIFARGTGFSGSPSRRASASPSVGDDDHLRRENKLLEDRIAKLQMYFLFCE